MAQGSWWKEPPNPNNNVTVTGNRIALDVPAGIQGLELDAMRTGTIDACTGPATCDLEASASVSLAF